MKLINSRTHGILDYLVGLFIIACPWLLNFHRGGMETWILVGSGLVTIIYSLLTNYEFALVRLISMRIHLMLDLVSGLLICFSPWLFGFSDMIWLPHVIIGITEILVVAFSTPVSDVEIKKAAFRREAL